MSGEPFRQLMSEAPRFTNSMHTTNASLPSFSVIATAKASKGP